jgi:hypothetical protein
VRQKIIGFRLGVGGPISTRDWIGARDRSVQGGPDLAGADAAQRRDFGGRADQCPQPLDRCAGRLPGYFGCLLGVGAETVGFAAGLGADPFGLFGGFEVVGEGGFDVFLAAQPGGVPGGFGLLGAAQGGRAG